MRKGLLDSLITRAAQPLPWRLSSRHVARWDWFAYFCDVRRIARDFYWREKSKLTLIAVSYALLNFSTEESAILSLFNNLTERRRGQQRLYWHFLVSILTPSQIKENVLNNLPSLIINVENLFWQMKPKIQISDHLFWKVPVDPSNLY